MIPSNDGYLNKENRSLCQEKIDPRPFRRNYLFSIFTKYIKIRTNGRTDIPAVRSRAEMLEAGKTAPAHK